MGGCSSKSEATHRTSGVAYTVSEGSVVLQEALLLCLHSAHNLPSLDFGSESDVYCIANLITKGAKNPIASARWPVKWDATDPMWNSCRLIGSEVVPAPDDRLDLLFFDHDDTSSDDLIGTAKCSVGQLTDGGLVGAELTLPIKLTKRAKRASRKGVALPCCVISRRLASDSPSRKVVYVVRHGESVWNKAQKDKDAVAMLSTVDHPLNEAGKEQAEGLRTALCEGVDRCADDALELMKAQAVWSSPLTRALETCLIALQPLIVQRSGPGCNGTRGGGGGGAATGGAAEAAGGEAAAAAAVEPLTVALNPNLREKRNFGGKDSSGKWCGDALSEGVHSELDKLFADDEATAKALSAVPLDLSQVQNRWWLGSKESEQHVGERIEELVSQVRFSPHSSIVLVGHSHYFREVLRRCRSPAGCTLTDAAGITIDPADADAKKLSNAGIARLDFDFTSEKPITSVRLLFNTQLVK